MTTENNFTDITGGLSADAENAAQQEQLAKAEPDAFVYIHHFQKPFTYHGITHERLTFDWGALTGADHLEIEDEMLVRGKSLIVPEYTGDFLCSMAVRACTERAEDGHCVLDAFGMRKMPMRDFQAICKRARSFLLRGA